MPEEKTGQIVKGSDGEGGAFRSQEISILLQKVLGGDSVPNFTERQIDELLSQKREITGYIHNDKNRESRDNKFYFFASIIFILIFSLAILWKKPDFLGEALSFFAGLFSGGFGGYGWASKGK